MVVVLQKYGNTALMISARDNREPHALKALLQADGINVNDENKVVFPKGMMGFMDDLCVAGCQKHCADVCRQLCSGILCL